ncbi:DUF2520 domain-containing protein [Saprospira sp. CCB-QB6]|uniref:Rossmann-like and DUF2520 domain-containing protein n=1 Tax=Saprospira sp. CCB-QB6 TaxID=3023936 RepID=UPI00234A7E49|nr:Rossmann-like and DUF2520 domain-containing protein [Saprospira sp. CCB-QB6]WCL80841.1 DUF2520 domain-containing protein [Saprospira sp. CCB-QB6]
MQIHIIGTGKVGQALGHAFFRAGHSIGQCYSRTAEKAQATAQALGGQAVYQLDQLSNEAGYYLLAVHDRAISEVLAQLPEGIRQERLILHCSGATPLSALAAAKQYGIFYPLQSFHEGYQPDLASIPICLAASSPALLEELKSLAESLACRYHLLEEEQWPALHLAAVMVNNFSNYLFAMGQTICEQAQIDPEILFPLILQTAQRLEEGPAKAFQTGPAIRGDQSSMQKHQAYLAAHQPQLQALYQLLSKRIEEDL